MPNMRRQAARRTSRFWWIALALVFVGGVVLWLAGVPGGAALPGLSLIGFVVVAWREVAPRAGHFPDPGLTAYGVSEPPRLGPTHDEEILPTWRRRRRRPRRVH